MSSSSITSIARQLTQWATDFSPSAEDLALAQRALADTVAVTLAAREHPINGIVAGMPEGARWATLGHVLDFDDLHLGSTTHISVVIVPTVLASGGDARAYLAGAGVMARLGNSLGWPHYSSGWHATCTAGAPAAAIAAGVSMGLDADQLATAMALAIPAAGGVQAAFGTHAKSLQVGFAVEAGIRAARLARDGATADTRAIDEWLRLTGGDPSRLEISGPAVPGGLGIKLFPCCYAMQRPIAALRDVAGDFPEDPQQIAQIRISTPHSGIHPLIHNRPETGLEAKFSLEYAVATAILDSYSGFEAFEDDAVSRPVARELMERVAVEVTPGGSGLLDGSTRIEIEVGDRTITAELDLPPGAPNRPPTDNELTAKMASCGSDVPSLMSGITWEDAPRLLAAEFPAASQRIA